MEGALLCQTALCVRGTVKRLPVSCSDACVLTTMRPKQGIEMRAVAAPSMVSGERERGGGSPRLWVASTHKLTWALDPTTPPPPHARSCQTLTMWSSTLTMGVSLLMGVLQRERERT